MTIDEIGYLYPDATHVVIGEKITGGTMRQRILVERYGRNPIELNVTDERVHGGYEHVRPQRWDAAATLHESFTRNVAAVGFEVTEYERRFTPVR